MYKPLFMTFLAVGVVLVIFGISAWKSLGSDISRLFTGVPTDNAIWMLVVGSALFIIGLAGSMRRAKAGV